MVIYDQMLILCKWLLLGVWLFVFTLNCVGSEGTLGIVTKISILTPPRLSSVNLAFLACKDYLSCQVDQISYLNNPIFSHVNKPWYSFFFHLKNYLGFFDNELLLCKHTCATQRFIFCLLFLNGSMFPVLLPWWNLKNNAMPPYMFFHTSGSVLGNGPWFNPRQIK